MNISNMIAKLYKHYNNLKHKNIKSIELNKNIITIIPKIYTDCFCLKIAQDSFDDTKYVIKFYMYDNAYKDPKKIKYIYQNSLECDLIKIINSYLNTYKDTATVDNILHRAIKNLKFKSEYELHYTNNNPIYNFVLSFENYFIKKLIISYESNTKIFTIKFNLKTYVYELAVFDFENIIEMINYIQEKLDSY